MLARLESALYWIVARLGNVLFLTASVITAVLIVFASASYVSATWGILALTVMMLILGVQIWYAIR